ncbi:MAG: hypothetical protein ABW139_16975 [Candidatus Thiodiazotropha sp. DIVDIV]
MSYTAKLSAKNLLHLGGLALLMAIPLILVANLILWFGYNLSVNNMKDRWQGLSELSVDSALYALEQRRNDLRADMKMLAAADDLVTAIGSYDEGVLSSLAADWEMFVAEKQLYDQVRLLDLWGIERLRVDRTPVGASRVSARLLQDKSQRYYFQKGLTLEAGDIYASPIDLNVERGEVERPYKPMVRLVTPLVDEKGEIKALLVVNALASHIFDDLERHAHLVEGDMLLLNDSGYYLRGFTSDQEWGFLFPDAAIPQQKFDETYPEVWALMQRSVSDQIANGDGIFSFRTVTYGSKGYQQTYRLVVAMLQEQQYILLAPQRTLWLVIAVTLSLLLLISSIIFSRYRFRQRYEKPISAEESQGVSHLLR